MQASKCAVVQLVHRVDILANLLGGLAIVIAKHVFTNDHFALLTGQMIQRLANFGLFFPCLRCLIWPWLLGRHVLGFFKRCHWLTVAPSETVGELVTRDLKKPAHERSFILRAQTLDTVERGQKDVLSQLLGFFDAGHSSREIPIYWPDRFPVELSKRGLIVGFRPVNQRGYVFRRLAHPISFSPDPP